MLWVLLVIVMLSLMLCLMTSCGWSGHEWDITMLDGVEACHRCGQTRRAL